MIQVATGLDYLLYLLSHDTQIGNSRELALQNPILSPSGITASSL